jgi:hypothetical protein
MAVFSIFSPEYDEIFDANNLNFSFAIIIIREIGNVP